ncbi:MAG: hypothetical protein OXN89_26950 [Bryobacterales bacterium]|nr:hypothetical protein [Bryobacterales bacterium]
MIRRTRFFFDESCVSGVDPGRTATILEVDVKRKEDTRRSGR